MARSVRSARSRPTSCTACERGVATLHPLEDHIIARLQREVHVRHHSRLVRDQAEQRLVDLGAIDRRQPKPRKRRESGQDRLAQCAEARRTGKVRAPAGQIDAGQHNFLHAERHMAFHFAQHLRHGERAARAPALGDDAEGAGMIAAVLDLHESARIVGSGAFKGARYIPASRIELGVVGDQAIDFGHGRDCAALDFGGAAGNEQSRIWMGAAGAADRLAGLAHGFRCHRAGVHHHKIIRSRKHRAHFLGLGQVEPASQRKHLCAHWPIP